MYSFIVIEAIRNPDEPTVGVYCLIHDSSQRMKRKIDNRKSRQTVEERLQLLEYRHIKDKPEVGDHVLLRRFTVDKAS